MVRSKFFQIFLALTLFIGASASWATIFMPISLDRQLEESNGVLWGSYQGKSYKKLPSGQVVSELAFKVVYSSGIQKEEIINPNSFKVIVPGGIWEGMVYQVSGVPSFKLGEESVLLLSKSNFGFRLSNLSLGKYNIQSSENGVYLSSEVFPKHSELGSIRLSKFQESLWTRFGEGLDQKLVDQEVSVPKTQRARRSIASVMDTEPVNKDDIEKREPASELSNEESAWGISSSSKIGMVWLMVIFSLIGTAIAFAFGSRR